MKTKKELCECCQLPICECFGVSDKPKPQHTPTLIRIYRPITSMKTIGHTTAFYNPENPVTVYELENGGKVSCELSHGWVEKWFEGDYREIAEKMPLSWGQYNEF